MSRTFRRDRTTTKYTLQQWIDRELNKYKRYQMLCLQYGWRPKWLERFFKTDEEIIKEATIYWNRCKRDGQGWTHGVCESALEGQVIGWKDGCKSMKPLAKRAARSQAKQMLAKYIKEYSDDDVLDSDA